MAFWILAVSYWIHLLATVVWLGGLALIALIAMPAFKKGTLARNEWLHLQRRFVPWVNLSLVLLLVTGFIQMTGDEHYTGFLQLDGLWAWAILIKHIGVIGMILITAYTQLRLYPALNRTAILAEQRPAVAAGEQDRLSSQETRLLRLNLLCAALVLLFTAIATAV